MDVFALFDGSLGGNLKINDGNGDTVTSIVASTIDGNVDIKAKAGNDIITVDAASLIDGHLRANFGTGAVTNNIDPTAIDGHIKIK